MKLELFDNISEMEKFVKSVHNPIILIAIVSLYILIQPVHGRPEKSSVKEGKKQEYIMIRGIFITICYRWELLGNAGKERPAESHKYQDV